MSKTKRLGKSFDEWYAEQCAADPDFDTDVKVLVEELRLQAQLYEARKVAGLTQDQVAERMQVNRSFVSRLENHPENMKLATLNKYARAVGMKVEIELHA
ncbi:helix-turn-helix domain-containing protein [Pontiella sulfatireligans]|uniref:Antitoxin HigA1 n=1 Tax=Pontiella sulfatireligans TaxID=2750658 RepID=A0A6C2UE81_9BACT|nr:helix-turn-helix transcriptional regulator [Pontiella sulfatireligans]VGO18480.1 Antitoxin HigA1 [Pontiella sulfatireligans]